VEVTREKVDFKPITVRFVIEDEETLSYFYRDFKAIGEGNCRSHQGTTYGVTDNLCEDIANQLSKYLED